MDSNHNSQEIGKRELKEMIESLSPGTILILDMPQADNASGDDLSKKEEGGDEEHGRTI